MTHLDSIIQRSTSPMTSEWCRCVVPSAAAVDHRLDLDETKSPARLTELTTMTAQPLTPLAAPHARRSSPASFAQRYPLPPSPCARPGGPGSAGGGCATLTAQQAQLPCLPAAVLPSAGQSTDSVSRSSK